MKSVRGGVSGGDIEESLISKKSVQSTQTKVSGFLHDLHDSHLLVAQTCSASPPSGNLVGGLPLVADTGEDRNLLSAASVRM